MTPADQLEGVRRLLDEGGYELTRQPVAFLMLATLAIGLQGCNEIAPFRGTPPSPTRLRPTVGLTVRPLPTARPTVPAPSLTPSPAPQSVKATESPYATPTPVFSWPEGLGPMDTLPMLDYVSKTFGVPDRILYRNGGLGHPMDYGADFSHRLDFTTLLVYDEEGIAFEIDSKPVFRETGRYSGTARLCMSYSAEEDPYALYQSSIYPRLVQVPQAEILYRDLSMASGYDISTMFSRLLTPNLCTTVATNLPHYTLQTNDVTNRADFTSENSQCQPPCWMSLTPGVSSANEIPQFFANLGVAQSDINVRRSYIPDVISSSAYFQSFPYQFPDLPPRVTVQETENGIIGLHVEGFNLAYISTTDLIHSLGTPASVYIWVDARVEVRYFTLILRYPDEQTSIFISGEMISKDPGSSQELICMSEVAGVRIDALFYAEAGDIYRDLTLWSDYPTSRERMRDEFIWISFPQDSTTQHSPFQSSVEDLAHLLQQNGACLPPLF